LQKKKKKSSVVVHAYNPSYLRGRSRKTVVGGQPTKVSWRPYLKNELKTKGLGEWLKW
jgi:hypothetical protein